MPGYNPIHDFLDALFTGEKGSMKKYKKQQARESHAKETRAINRSRDNSGMGHREIVFLKDGPYWTDPTYGKPCGSPLDMAYVAQLDQDRKDERRGTLDAAGRGRMVLYTQDRMAAARTSTYGNAAGPGGGVGVALRGSFTPQSPYQFPPSSVFQRPGGRRGRAGATGGNYSQQQSSPFASSAPAANVPWNTGAGLNSLGSSQNPRGSVFASGSSSQKQPKQQALAGPAGPRSNSILSGTSPRSRRGSQRPLAPAPLGNIASQNQQAQQQPHTSRISARGSQKGQPSHVSFAGTSQGSTAVSSSRQLHIPTAMWPKGDKE